MSRWQQREGESRGVCDSGRSATPASTPHTQGWDPEGVWGMPAAGLRGQQLSTVGTRHSGARVALGGVNPTCFCATRSAAAEGHAGARCWDLPPARCGRGGDPRRSHAGPTRRRSPRSPAPRPLLRRFQLVAFTWVSERLHLCLAWSLLPGHSGPFKDSREDCHLCPVSAVVGRAKQGEQMGRQSQRPRGWSLNIPVTGWASCSLDFVVASQPPCRQGCHWPGLTKNTGALRTTTTQPTALGHGGGGVQLPTAARVLQCRGNSNLPQPIL